MKMTQTQIQDAMKRFAVDCREQGLSVTHQRLVLFEELVSTDAHPTAEDLFENVRHRFPTISLGTVYKNLETFENHGFIARIDTASDRARFDANLAPHHHLICRVCGHIEDHYDPSLESLAEEAQVASDFKIENTRIHFRGVCGSCSNK